MIETPLNVSEQTKVTNHGCRRLALYSFASYVLRPSNSHVLVLRALDRLSS